MILNEILTNFVLLSFFLGVIKLNILMIEKSEQSHLSFKTITHNLLDIEKKSSFSYSPPFTPKRSLFRRIKRGQLHFENNHYYLNDKINEKLTRPKNLNQ